MKNRQSALSSVKNILGAVNRVGPLAAFIILCAVLQLATGGKFLTSANIANIFRQIPTVALMALGMLHVILLGGIDLSAGALLAIGICTAGIFVRYELLPMNGATGILLLVICVLVSTAFGALNGILLTKLRLPHPFISTMGTKYVCRGLALLITGAATISGFPKTTLVIGTFNVSSWLPLSFLLVIVIYALSHVFFTKTALGRKIYSLGGNKEAAKFAGIAVDRVQIFCYAASGFFCGLAGIVYMGRLDSAVPLATQDGDADAIASCIIGGASFLGGKGNVWGTLIGAFIIQVIRNGCNLLRLSTDLQSIVIGAIIIIAVFIDVLRGEMDQKNKLQAIAKANAMQDTEESA